ncbi:SMP-30/gluconolactonase/LRE family protein [Caulobacter sp. S45]|jgi:gluconolactonase|uniref:SMP-30/gluconolactonase/LRE family protein n=1 Tax=Caulobacter sp. S45 TaxID=1641861 RepID=UPI00131DE00D|nr:SMP-30/gluconolactonase/LRE family protein [Caulobacter sp. S45]
MRVLASGLQFPEGPVAMPDGSVLLVEMARETLSRVRPDGRVEVAAKVPGGPNGAAVGPDGRIYLCNNGGMGWVRDGAFLRPKLTGASFKGGSIDVVDLSTGKLERLYDRCGAHLLGGPNDLVFDRHGGFWFTDNGKRRERDLDFGYIYWAKADGSEIREVVGGLMTPNGVGLSPDHKTLYMSETITGRLMAWDVTGPGELRKRTWPALHGGDVVGSDGGRGLFDSLAVSASGRVCVATLYRAAVSEFDPATGLVRREAVPDMLPTNICFGGADMCTAWITLSHEGRLVETQWREPGLRLEHQTLPGE